MPTVEWILWILRDVTFVDRFQTIAGRRRNERSIFALIDLLHGSHHRIDVQRSIVILRLGHALRWDAVPVLRYSRLILVITRPENDRRVILQSLHLIDHFRVHIVQKRLIDGITKHRHLQVKSLGLRIDSQAAGEHEIMPEHDAQTVSDLIEGIAFVDATAPDAQHVHVGQSRRREQAFEFVVGHTLLKGVRRDPVAALDEYRPRVDAEVERRAVNHRPVAHLNELHRTEADRTHADLLFMVVDTELVESLVTEAIRPPERDERVGNVQ